MNATRVVGIIAAVSGTALLVVVIASGAAAAVGGISSLGASAGDVFRWPSTSSGFMGGGMMGGGSMGPGMMGSGMGPGMMSGWGAAAGTTSAAIPGAPEVRVAASEFTLSPAEVVLPAGTAVNLTLENKGGLPHDLTIPGLGVRIVAAAGQTQTVGLRTLPAGSYPAYCSVSGHAAAGMRATVVVQ